MPNDIARRAVSAPKIIEDAVAWRGLGQTMADVDGGFSHLSDEDLDKMLDELIIAVRQADQFIS